MNELEKPKGVNPEDKEAINKEGWEGNAAVIIGKKEEGEVDRLRENLENEGQCADAATFIRLNKRIAVPADNVSEDIKKQVGNGWIGSTKFIFVDSQGNIAEVNFDYSKIASIESKKHIHQEDYRKKVDLLVKELEPRGFKIEQGKSQGGFQARSFMPIGRAMSDYENEIKQLAKERKKAEFDF